MGNRTTKKKVVGRKNTVIKAIPKPLYKVMLQIQKEIQDKDGKKRKVTLLEAGLELARRTK